MTWQGFRCEDAAQQSLRETVKGHESDTCNAAAQGLAAAKGRRLIAKHCRRAPGRQHALQYRPCLSSSCCQGASQQYTVSPSVVHVVGALRILLPHRHRLLAQQRLALDPPLALGLAQLPQEVLVLKPGGVGGVGAAF